MHNNHCLLQYNKTCNFFDSLHLIRQFTPDQQPVPEQQNLENVIEDADSRLRNFLRSFHYVQHSQPKKRDIIHFYDWTEEDFVKVRINSKSNYRYYYNIRFLELDHPDASIFLEPNGFWSHSTPVPANIDQEHFEEDAQDQGDGVLPPIEEERRGRHNSSQRQISPMIYQHGISSVRPDSVSTSWRSVSWSA